ncbi:MAG: VOC family protein [Gallionellaceae bacterium]|nr:VOC family protein [Gallionellaceae bacterium]
MQKITPFLWFDHQAEEAANFYVAIFKNSKIIRVDHYGKGAPMPEGTVLTASFELSGQRFVALNAGPMFQFTPAVSFMVECEDQAEVDYYWDKLSADPEAEACGWLKDKFGVSWQVAPRQWGQLISDADPVKAGRVMQAMMQMKKIDIAGLLQAYDAA